MNAESIRVTKTEAGAWANWERLVINGIYPLRRLLGGSDHSAVFLTEYRAESLTDVAIKFMPADPSQAEAQLVLWGTAATLSHPHLIRLFDVGRCRVRGREYLFVVMEHAEQTLAQILPKRALTADEVLELLPPALDALAFLHRNYLAHGQLKPSNFLVVNDQLKLASDTVRPIGNSTGLARTSAYDPPELRESGNSAAGDVWGLGITLVEALTQRAPAWGEDQSETAALLTTIPPPFVEAVLRCLSRAPASRPTVMELEGQYRPGSLQSNGVTAPAQPVEPEAAADNHPRERSNKGPLFVGALTVVLIISLAIWVGVPPFQRGSDFQQVAPEAAPPAPVSTFPAVASGPAQAASSSETNAAAQAGLPPAASETPPLPPTAPSTSAATPPVASAPAAKAAANRLDSPTSPAAEASGVIHQEMPDIPRAIREKIRGHVSVTVRVLVDPSGTVVGQFMENAGPSRYFARQAGDAAVKWTFVPAENVGSRVWLLRFEFTRDSATVRVSNAQ